MNTNEIFVKLKLNKFEPKTKKINKIVNNKTIRRLTLFNNLPSIKQEEIVNHEKRKFRLIFERDSRFILNTYRKPKDQNHKISLDVTPFQLEPIKQDKIVENKEKIFKTNLNFLSHRTSPKQFKKTELTKFKSMDYSEKEIVPYNKMIMKPFIHNEVPKRKVIQTDRDNYEIRKKSFYSLAKLHKKSYSTNNFDNNNGKEKNAEIQLLKLEINNKDPKEENLSKVDKDNLTQRERELGKSFHGERLLKIKDFKNKTNSNWLKQNFSKKSNKIESNSIENLLLKDNDISKVFNLKTNIINNNISFHTSNNSFNFNSNNESTKTNPTSLNEYQKTHFINKILKSKENKKKISFLNLKNSVIGGNISDYIEKKDLEQSNLKTERVLRNLSVDKSLINEFMLKNNN